MNYASKKDIISIEQSDSINTKTSSGAVLRSALIPGWGQLYLNKPLKGIIFFLGECYLISEIIKYDKIYGYVRRAKDIVGIEEWVKMSEEEKIEKVFELTGYNLTIGTERPRRIRNKNCWWAVGTYIFCLLDAYVDAHLLNFSEERVVISPIANIDELGIEVSIELER